jgi:glutamate N-acetyltransferase / amino-acid N-acetyltransferase
MIPKGFLFSTAEAAIKKPGRKDLALIYSETEADMAGAFTTNRVKAAPVKLDIRKIKSGKGQAIVINSGNANACTGEKGLKDSGDMARFVSDALKIKSSLVYVCSTGVIGAPMPMHRIKAKIPALAANLGESSLEDVAAAMMTTDTYPKIVKKRVRAGNKTGIIAGICKGAGMISPRMATMLCFILTDFAVDRKTMDSTLIDAVNRSFNRITIDGDMSTNDTVLMMANGALGNRAISERSSLYPVFNKALHEVLYALSELIVKDGEGATKFIEIEVRGAGSKADAEKAAFAVANSNLVKTAMYGNDANWGRIMAALGYSGAIVREEKTDIYLGKVRIAHKGAATGTEKEATRALKKKDIRIMIDLHIGGHSAKVLTCDLTEDYIRVNADYRT